MSLLVYFSTKSENTHRFVQKLGVRALRLPLQASEAADMRLDEPYVLLTPTYGGGGVKGAVPRPVIEFLNQPGNRAGIRGVMASGNTNFGEAFCLAGKIVAQKCNVPYLYSFELLGTEDDVLKVRKGLAKFWREHLQASLQEA